MIIFESILTTFEAATFFEAPGEVVEISSSLNIMNFNQVKLVQIRDTHSFNKVFENSKKSKISSSLVLILLNSLKINITRFTRLTVLHY